MNLRDVNKYYSLNDKDTKVFEIEVLGEVIDEGNKSVTNKFKVVREIDRSEYKDLEVYPKFEYDKKNNLIKEKYSDGSWLKFEYDENNNLIKHEYSNGYFTKYKYDENNNKIKEEYSYGFWMTYEYDKKNNLIKEKHSDGIVYEIKIST
jgi:YD repeat-containing protein